jgi:NADH dehydrogenase
VFDESRLAITLIEAGPRILPALPERLAAAAQAELEALGVSVRCGLRVTEARPHEIVTEGHGTIEADLLVWAAGVKAPPLLATLGLETNRNNQLVVRETLQTTTDERIFAIGDCCSCTPPGRTSAVPPRAQAAHQMARAVFANLVRAMAGKPLRAFEYHDHGSLVSLSRFSTVGSLMGSLVGGRMAIEGRLARLVYTSLYRMHLIAIHGWLKGLALLAVGRVNRIVRPRLKLH